MAKIARKIGRGTAITEGPPDDDLVDGRTAGPDADHASQGADPAYDPPRLRFCFIAAGEVSEMKDPVILCFLCQQPGARLRKQSGYRCKNEACPHVGSLIATDGQVAFLKAMLRKESEQEMLEWARGCQK